MHDPAGLVHKTGLTGQPAVKRDEGALRESHGVPRRIEDRIVRILRQVKRGGDILQEDVVDAEHVALHGVWVRPDDFDLERVRPGVEIVNAHIQNAGRHDAPVEKVDRFAELFTVQIKLNDAVINGLGQLHLQAIPRRFLHGHRQIERIARLGVGPPQMSFLAPLSSVPAHILCPGIPGGPGQNLELFPFQGALDLEYLDRSPVSRAFGHGHRLVGIGLAGRLIPIGYCGVERRLIVRIIFFDSGLESTLERNVIGDMPAIDADVAAVVHADRLVVVAILEQRRIAPGVAEIILRTGADGGGELLAIDEKFLVAFAPPAASRIPDVEHDAAESPAARRLEHGPVDCPALGLVRQEGVTMPFGMEPAEFPDVAFKRHVNDFQLDFSFHLAIVLNHHFRPLCKRHVPVAIPPAILR